MTESTCPLCKAPAYVGFTAVECPTAGCAHYSEKQVRASRVLPEITMDLSTFEVDWTLEYDAYTQTFYTKPKRSAQP